MSLSEKDREIDALCEALSLEWDAKRQMFENHEGERISRKTARSLLQAAREEPSQEGAVEPAKGWLYHCPDTGTEWSDNHPIESGEVPDAKDVRPATLDALHAELMAAWEVLAERPSPPNPQEGAGENTVGAAEAEVGRYVYRRIEALMGATDGTAEGRELSYLSAVAASVEEYGEEACAGTDLAAEHFGQEGAVEPVAWTGVTHVLKTWPEPFEAVADGLKPWELRRNDRGFKVGDRLVLHKFNPETAEYLGAKVTRLVTWMLEGPAFGLPEARRNIREKLDELHDEALRPLTEWKTAEQVRVDKIADTLAEISNAGQARLEDTSETVEARLSTLEAMELDPDVFRDQLPTVQAELTRAIDNLQLAHARILKEESDRAELEALRKEAAERAEREAAERQAAEAARMASRSGSRAPRRRARPGCRPSPTTMIL